MKPVTTETKPGEAQGSEIGGCGNPGKMGFAEDQELQFFTLLADETGKPATRVIENKNPKACALPMLQTHWRLHI